MSNNESLAKAKETFIETDDNRNLHHQPKGNNSTLET